MVCYALLPSDLHLAPMNHGFFFSALRRPWNAFLARLIKRPMLHFQEYFPAAAPTYVPRELRVSMDDVVAHHPRLTHQKIKAQTPGLNMYFWAQKAVFTMSEPIDIINYSGAPVSSTSLLLPPVKRYYRNLLDAWGNVVGKTDAYPDGTEFVQGKNIAIFISIATKPSLGEMNVIALEITQDNDVSERLNVANINIYT